MDVVLDVSAVPMTEEQIQAILDKHSQLIQEDVKDSVRENVSVPTSIAFGQEKRFILPGNSDEFKEYETAQAMIADQLPLPDPIFKQGEVVPSMYDAGVSLMSLETYEQDFKDMIEEMFKSGPELKLTKEGIEELLKQR